MVDVKAQKDCCGCTACESICAHQAISMKPDALGFLYPEVDKDKCTNCGACESVCQFHDNYDVSLNLGTPVAYAVRHKNMAELMKSRSGAAFVAISDYILEQGGIVYGVGYENHFHVVHKRATTKEERDEFRGSKYVQSDLTGIFRSVRDDLKQGYIVLFTGTPCQTSGLNSYVGKALRKDLILVDIVCHGVPSPFVWRDYLSLLEKKWHDVIEVVNFRDKEHFGWKAHKESYVLKNGEFKTSSLFTYLFYRHIMLRYSCANCHFTNTNRPSDLTLADFWKWEDNVPGMNDDNKGIGLVLVNTKKGKDVFNMIKDAMVVKSVHLENCLQPNLQRPSKLHPKRLEFEQLYKKNGFHGIVNQYCRSGWKHRTKTVIRRFVKRFLK